MLALLNSVAELSEPTRWPALTRPRISVIICNYNYAQYLEHAIRSAVKQSYPCEVIVVDDGSTDDSVDIINGWRDQVKVILQDNLGQRGAYNTGFSHASGDVLIFLDADDFLFPNAAETVASQFGENVAKVHFRLQLVDSGNLPIGSTIPNRLASGNLLLKLLNHGLLYASAPGSGNAYRRDALAKLLPLPTDKLDRHSADFFTIYGVVALGEVNAIQETLGAYRVHPPKSGEGVSRMRIGNASQNDREYRRIERRSIQFAAWLADRTDVLVRRDLVDFSQLKTLLSETLVSMGYFNGLGRRTRLVSEILRVLWHDDEWAWPQKVTLATWAAALWLGPATLVKPLAMYVSNPAARPLLATSGTQRS